MSDDRIKMDGERVVFTIADDENDAFQTFRAGIDDHKQWRRHEVTNQLHQFVNDNKRFSQVFVSHKGSSIRIK